MRRAEALQTLRDRVRPVTLTREHRLPVLEPLQPLLPEGLGRGTSVAVSTHPGAGGGTTLTLALAAAASRQGAWVAAVGFGSLGLAAAAELGVALERLVVIAAPRREAWGGVVATLVDGFDVVLVHPGRGLRAGDARRLVARARERGAVLVRHGGGWPEAPDVDLRVVASCWEGLEDGYGHLRRRRATVEVAGRRGAARVRRAELWLPGPGGAIEALLAEPTPLHRPARRHA